MVFQNKILTEDLKECRAAASLKKYKENYHENEKQTLT